MCCFLVFILVVSSLNMAESFTTLIFCSALSPWSIGFGNPKASEKRTRCLPRSPWWHVRFMLARWNRGPFNSVCCHQDVKIFKISLFAHLVLVCGWLACGQVDDWCSVLFSGSPAWNVLSMLKLGMRVEWSHDKSQEHLTQLSNYCRWKFSAS